MRESAVEQQAEESKIYGKEAGGVSVIGVLIALSRRWQTIAAAIAAAIALGIALAFLLPAAYTATTVLLPPQDRSSTSMLMSQLGALGSVASAAGADMGLKNPDDLYVSLLQTEPVEQAVVQQLDLRRVYHKRTDTDARAALEKHTSITNGSKDGLIRIAVTDRRPARAAAIANAYVAIFQRYSQTKAISEAAQRRAFFASQLLQAKGDLDTAEIALKQAEQSKGVVQLGSQSMALVQSAASLRAQIAAKEVEVRAMRAYAGDKNVNLMMAEQQLSGWQAQLAGLTGGQSASSDGLMMSGSQMPEVELVYAQRVRDVKYDETIFDILAKQFEMAKLDEAREGDRIQVMAPAIVPEKRSGPPRLLLALGSAIFGLVASALYVLFAEGFREMQRDPAHRAALDELARPFRRKVIA